MELQIKCQGATTVALDELSDLQPENFKRLTEDNYVRLRNNLSENGFCFPIQMWVDSEGKKYIIDAHQRKRTLTRMRDEGWIIPLLPADIIEAQDRAEAKKILLLKEFPYGTLTSEGMTDFLTEDNLVFDDIEPFLPDDALGFIERNENAVHSSFPEVEEDEAPEIDTKNPAISQLGEVYQLGRHRLMCGDATKIEDVEKLMNGQKADMIFTDPPYGVSYGDKNKFLNAIARGNHIQENIDNDTKSVVEMKQLWIDAFTNMNAVTKAGGSYYVCSPQGGELMMMMMSLMESGWELKQSIIWVKNNHVLGRSDYHYRHEPILYGWKEGEAHKFYGGPGQTTAWFIDRPNKSELHPTMKPIQLVAKAINNSSKGDDIVLDPFLGSGSTLIASEQANRSCYALEVDPKYVDVCRKRYAKFIGQAENWIEATPVIEQARAAE